VSCICSILLLLTSAWWFPAPSAPTGFPSTFSPKKPPESYVDLLNRTTYPEVLWNHTYNWSESGYPNCFLQIIESRQEGFIVLGTVGQNYLFKMDEQGNIQWNQTLDFFPSGRNSLLELPNGDIITSGIEIISPLEGFLLAMVIRFCF
jgi:hypothetical protein